jgi:hypothetical protein
MVVGFTWLGHEPMIYHTQGEHSNHYIDYVILKGLSWPWSYGSWIYNYLCNQCLSPLMLCRFTFTNYIIEMCTIVIIYYDLLVYYQRLVWCGFMVFNATFNNISVISWRWVLLVEESGGPGEDQWPAASHWQTLSHNVLLVLIIN